MTIRTFPKVLCLYFTRTMIISTHAARWDKPMMPVTTEDISETKSSERVEPFSRHSITNAIVGITNIQQSEIMHRLFAV